MRVLTPGRVNGKERARHVVVKIRWVVVGALAVLGLGESGCRRRQAENRYEWVAGGESGAAGADDENQGGQSGKGNAGSGGAGGKGVGGTAGAATGGSAPASTGGSSAGGAGRRPNGGRGGTAGGPTGSGSSAGGGFGGEDAQEGGAGGTAPDPCFGASDNDEDGVTDPCDDDDDDDGYLDIDDVAPSDPFEPGGLAAPGTITNDACVKGVLAELESLGMPMPVHRERFPPEMNGYYRRAAGQGKVLAANDGAMVGATTYGMEARVGNGPDVDRFDAAVIDFWNGEPTSFGIGQGGWVRGRGADFTHYGGSGGLVMLYSATRGASGSWLDGFYLSILLPTSGLPHAECPTGAGKYRFMSAPLTSYLEPADLLFMCVDQDAGYVPTERWKRNRETCECTSEYQVSCTEP
jgi:hypothetical protein